MAMTNNMNNFMGAVDKTAGLNALNPGKLQKEFAASKNTDFIKGIAMQQAKSVLEDSIRDTQMAFEDKGTVLDQRGNEILELAMQTVQGNAETGMGVKQKSQQKAQKGMMKQALGQQQGGAPGLIPGQPKPQMPQGRPQMPQGRPQMPQGIAAAGRPQMPQGMPQGMPQMPQGMPQMPQGMPQRRGAQGGLMRFQEGGDVEDPRKKRNMLQRGFDYVRENPLQAAGTAALTAASVHPLGRLAKGAVSMAPRALSGIKQAGRAAVTEPKYARTATGQMKNQKGRFTKDPLQEARTFSPGRASATSGVAGAGMLGLGALTSGGEQAPAPQAPPQPEPGFAPPAEKPMTEREALMARKPALPTRSRSGADRFNTFALNAGDGLGAAGRALAAQDESDFGQKFEQALAERQTWAIELKDLTTRDVAKMGNVRQYATELQRAETNLYELLYESSNLSMLEMAAASGDEDAIAKYNTAKNQLMKDFQSLMIASGLRDKKTQVDEMLQTSLGLRPQSLNTDTSEDALIGMYGG